MTHDSRHNARTCEWCLRRNRHQHAYRDPLGINPVGDPRLPWEPLARRLDLNAGYKLTTLEQAEALDIDAAQIHRWRKIDVGFHKADELATHLGLHPAEIWPDDYVAAELNQCPYRLQVNADYDLIDLDPPQQLTLEMAAA